MKCHEKPFEHWTHARIGLGLKRGESKHASIIGAWTIGHHLYVVTEAIGVRMVKRVVGFHFMQGTRSRSRKVMLEDTISPSAYRMRHHSEDAVSVDLRDHGYDAAGIKPDELGG